MVDVAPVNVMKDLALHTLFLKGMQKRFLLDCSSALVFPC